MRFRVIYLYVFLVIISCDHPKINKPDTIAINDFDSKKIKLLEIDPRKFVKKELLLTDIANEVIYIPIDNYFLIETIHSLKVTENAIYITTGYNPILLKYTRQGKNPIQIGQLGDGPGEYLWCRYFAIDTENDLIYIYGKVNTVLVFNTKGKYLREFQFPKDGGFGFANMEIFNNSNLFIAQFGLGANALYNWIITDSLGNLMSYKKNTTQSFETTVSSGGGIFKYKEAIYYYVGYNDTVFSISPDFNYKLSYLFTPGDHRRPKKDPKFISPEDFMNSIIQYYSPGLLIETNHFLINRYLYKGKQRITFIDKQSKKNYTSYYEGNKVLSGGIINNFDGGLKFRPQNYFVENGNEYLVGMLFPYQIIDHANSDEFKNSTPKYPEKKKELEQLANSLNENDNPVLMLVKLKE